MKFLRVSGEGDYSAMTFLDNFDGDLEELFEKVNNCENGEMVFNLTILYEEDEGKESSYEEEINLEALELNIDEDAFDYLRDQWFDYDQSKATDIIPIGEWE